VTRSLARTFAALRRLARGPWFPRRPGGEAGGLAGPGAAADGVLVVRIGLVDIRPVEAVIDALERLARAGRLAPRSGARLARACRRGGDLFLLEAEPDPAGGALDYVARVLPGKLMLRALAAARATHAQAKGRWLVLHRRSSFLPPRRERGPP